MDIMTLLSREQGKAIIVVTHDIQVAARAQRQFQFEIGARGHPQVSNGVVNTLLFDFGQQGIDPAKDHSGSPATTVDRVHIS